MLTRWKSGYKNYGEYLETMKAYNFIPLSKEHWESIYQSTEERISENNNGENI